MIEKKIPFTKNLISEIIKKYPTPFHIYDGRAIALNARKFHQAFDWLGTTQFPANGKFRNYFAVKALPNPAIMELLAKEGLGFDCSSLAELELCKRIGVSGENVFFTSNDTKAEEYARAKELGAIINLDDISHIDYLDQNCGLPDTLCFRYNPGPLRQGNALIGKPEEAKYGLTHTQIIQAYTKAQRMGVKHFGLHTMVASNELNPEYFIETARMLFELALEIQQKTGISIEFINLGGGIGIPYRPEQSAVDLLQVSDGIKKLYQSLISGSAISNLRLCMENGRVITGPYGYLVAQAIHEKHIYKEYIGLDACMANLMRPGMYGAYHHITVLGKEMSALDHIYDITGSLCENNDKFAIDRLLPQISIGDFIVIHDTGAHGHSMGFNYNGKLRSAEFLINDSGSVEMIRRAETLDDYFATLNFPKQ